MKNTERFYYIGDHIRRLRESKGWTQQELGKRLGEKTSTISAYETNAKLPSAECLIEMAELFGISLDTLILWRKCRAAFCSLIVTRTKRAGICTGRIFWHRTHKAKIH